MKGFASGAQAEIYGGRYYGFQLAKAQERLMKQQNRDNNILEDEGLHDQEGDDNLMTAIESLPEEVQAQLWSQNSMGYLFVRQLIQRRLDVTLIRNSDRKYYDTRLK